MTPAIIKSSVLFSTGSTQTKVTYLPGGAVVVLFPSNLTVAIETGEHPIMENEHRMHYKRKILVPNSYFHRLEWRFYLRRKGRTRQSRIIEKIGTRMRVGAHFPRHAHMHEWHEDGIKEKALLVCRHWPSDNCQCAQTLNVLLCFLVFKSFFISHSKSIY